MGCSSRVMMALSTQHAGRCDQKGWMLPEGKLAVATEAAAHPSIWGSTSTVSMRQPSSCMPCMSKSAHGTSSIKGSTRSKSKRTSLFKTLLDKLAAVAPTAAPAACTAALSRHFGRPVTKPSMLASQQARLRRSFVASVQRSCQCGTNSGSDNSNTKASPPKFVYL